MRRSSIISIAAIVVILAAAWAAGWFWLAGWAEARATTTLQELSDQGVDVACKDRGVSGFPFAIRITCSEAAVAERTSDTKADLAGVSGGASVFAPMTVTIDMASPVRVASLRLEQPAEMRWENAALNVGMGTNGPRDVSFVTRELDAAFVIAQVPLTKVTAESAEGFLAPSSNGGTSGSFIFADLRLSLLGIELPPLTGTVVGELSVPPRALLAGRAGMAAPVMARGISITLESGGVRFHAEGEIALDAEGVVDGRITVQIAGTEELAALIASLPPTWQKPGNLVAGGLFALGTPATLEGQPASEMTVDIARGDVMIGILELFTLPRVPL